MANNNTSRANGLRPVKYQNGVAWNGAVTEYVVLAAVANAVFVGDTLELVATEMNTAGTHRSVIQSSSISAATVGVVVGFKENPLNLNIDGTFRPSGAQTADRIAYVVDDPRVIFEVEATAAVPTSYIGYVCHLTLTEGNSATGTSGYVLDASTAKAAGSTDKLVQIVGFPNRPDNTINESFNKVLVMFLGQKHYGAQAAGVGI